MTAVDPLFPQPPEITVLGPMGSFRLFGTHPNDNHFETRTWSLGRQRCRGSTGKQPAARRAASSSISTTAAPTRAARAARSPSRRSRIFWWG